MRRRRSLLVTAVAALALSAVPAPPPASAGQMYPSGPVVWAVSGSGIHFAPDLDSASSPLTSGADFLPAWSSKANRIVFVRGSDLWVMDADGTGQELLLDDTASIGTVSWSPDDQHIAHSRSPAGSFDDVWVMDADGTGSTNLTSDTNGSDDRDPDWSPDGTRIAYRGGDDIITMNPDGTDKRNITLSPGQESQPAWSPDSTKIAYMAPGNGGATDIWVMNADGTGKTNLTDDPGADINPAWSPTGSHLAFVSKRDGNNEVYAMDADGDNQNRITTTTAGEFSPDWTADCEEDFPDTPAWVATAVDWVFCLNHMTGYPDGTFKPNLDITRGQLGRLLYRAAGSPDVSGLPPAGWSDVPPWLDDTARWLDDNAFMTGYPDGTFRPNDPISRGQVARATYRVQGSPVGAPPHPFTDVPPWLEPAVDWAAHDPDNGGPLFAPMTGYPDDTFRDTLDITRAQTTRLTCRANTPPAPCQQT